jgi:hypothetical protein
MPTKQRDQQHTGPEGEAPQREALIGKQVLRALGQPGDLRRVEVRRLWDGHYRANVLVGPDAASARIAHSYFLATDDAGNILTSTPEVTRLY